MKKILLIVFGIILLSYLVIFIADVILNVKKFTELNNKLPETPYALRNRYLVAKNIRTGNMDTLKTGEPAIINIWATWCKPCIEEIPALHRLNQTLGNIPVVFVTFDSAALKPGKLDSLGIVLPAYFLQDTSVIQKPLLLPTTLLIKHDSVLNAEYGARDWMDSTIISRISQTLN